MNLVVPISDFDKDLLDPMMDLLLAYGHRFNGHHCTVVPAQSVKEQGERFADFAEDALKFDKVEFSPMDREPTGGWPRACNQQFHQCAFKAFSHFPADPWYFFELDNTPMVPDWLDQLSVAYYQGGKPFCGKLHPTHRRQSRESTEFYQQDIHMVGTGIYVSNLIEASTCINFLDSDPFDVALQYEIVNHWGCTDTHLIQHNWKTGNYRRDNLGRIVCDSLHVGPVPPGVTHAKPVEQGVAVLHGCKDASLAKLLVAEMSESKSTVEVINERLAPEMPSGLATQAIVDQMEKDYEDGDDMGINDLSVQDDPDAPPHPMPLTPATAPPKSPESPNSGPVPESDERDSGDASKKEGVMRLQPRNDKEWMEDAAVEILYFLNSKVMDAHDITDGCRGVKPKDIMKIMRRHKHK